MSSSKAPKQWSLGKDESINTFNAWKDNLVYTLSLDTKFTRFLVQDASWLKFSSTDVTRGFTDDGTVTKEDQVKQLNLFLGQIANYATVISRNQIVRNSISLTDIWSKLREHYGLQVTGSKFIDLINIQLIPGELSGMKICINDY